MEDRNNGDGYGKPPKDTQFQKGSSGNPKGRPRGGRRGIPHDTLLGQMVTIRDEGRERRVTAAEAFLLQLTKRGLEGCGASARASLASIENARSIQRTSRSRSEVIQFKVRLFGLCCIVEDLGMAVRLNEASEENVRLKLKPWVVEAALARVSAPLTLHQQQVVFDATRTPGKVRWPDWWVIRA